MSAAQENGSLQTKKYICVVCRHKLIVESRIEHRLPSDEVPDVGGCDYSTYTDHKVTGGKLLEKRPDVGWNQFPDPMCIFGGICEDCLKTDTIILLLPNINLTKEPEK